MPDHAISTIRHRCIHEKRSKFNELLAKYPSIGRAGRVLGTRELVVGDPPYIIAYRVRDQDLEILRVLHTSRAWPEEL